MPRIILTGGGTAGHVTPNIALIPALRKNGYDISYIGSHEGMEKGMIKAQGIPYYSISTGKLRRYFAIRNITDPFRVIKGFFDAVSIIRKVRPRVIFSKGGFVSVPVVWAAKICNVPCIIHESDMTPGLANRLCIPFAKYVCCNFPETKSSIPANKVRLTGSPLRESLLHGDGAKGREFCGFDNNDMPVILVAGGSLGAAAINKTVREALQGLLSDFNVAHICGRGKLDESLTGTPGYVQFEFVDEQMGDLLAMADIIISRAGANAICEFLALRKPALLIPLPAKSSRGDQIKNAESFESRGFSLTLPEEELNVSSLLNKTAELYCNRMILTDNMKRSHEESAVDIIMDLIKSI